MFYLAVFKNQHNNKITKLNKKSLCFEAVLVKKKNKELEWNSSVLRKCYKVRSFDASCCAVLQSQSCYSS